MEGAKIIEGVRVTGFEVEGGARRGCGPTRATSTARSVVNAAGMWGREIGQMAGMRVPSHRRRASVSRHRSDPRHAEDHADAARPRSPASITSRRCAASPSAARSQTRCPSPRRGIPPGIRPRAAAGQFRPLRAAGRGAPPSARRSWRRWACASSSTGPIPYSADSAISSWARRRSSTTAFVCRRFPYGIAGGRRGRADDGGMDRRGAPSLDLWPLDVRRFAFHHDDASTSCIRAPSSSMAIL